MMKLVLTAFLFVSGADRPEIRPELETTLKRLADMTMNLDEDKALKELEELSKRKDLTPAELAQVEMWRGVALQTMLRDKEGTRSFEISRGCNPLLEIPGAVSPKIRHSFTSAIPGDCPSTAGGPSDEDPLDKIMAPSKTPPPKVPGPITRKGGKKKPPGVARKGTPRPAPVESSVEEPKKGGGMLGNVLKFGGLGLGGVGALVLVVTLVGLVASGVLLGVSFPVFSQAEAAERATQARQLANVAGGLRISGLGVAVVAALAFLPAVLAIGVGVAAAISGFVLP